MSFSEGQALMSQLGYSSSFGEEKKKSSWRDKILSVTFFLYKLKSKREEKSIIVPSPSYQEGHLELGELRKQKHNLGGAEH